MDLDVVKKIMTEYCESNDLMLYDVKFVREFGYLTLQVFIDKKGGIDVDSLALANEYLSTKLDSIDLDMQEYMLEVSSPGAEKVLRNVEEVKDSIGEYIHAETKDMHYEGYLLSFENEILEVQINIKGRLKKVNINYADVTKIRLAVKI